MCNLKHCQRTGCENHIPANRTDDFCSNKCKETQAVLKEIALKDSYKELGLGNLPLNLKNTKKEKKCLREGCENLVKKRGKKSKYCSLSCSFESKKKYQIIPCGHCSTPFQSNRFKKYFCSRECHRASIKVERYCAYSECGKLLSNLKGVKTYCSNECYKKSISAGVIKFDTCQLEECGKALSYSQKRSQQKYCSHECFCKNKQKASGNSIGKIGMRKAKHWEYPRRYIKTERGWILLARYTWEQANGPLPPYHFISYKDGNTFNDSDINNLEIFHVFNSPNRKNNKQEQEHITESSGEFFSVKDFEL